MENKVILNKWIFAALAGASCIGFLALGFCYLTISGKIAIG